MGELNLNVPRHVGKRPDLHYAANRVLPRLQIRENQHLSGADGRGHPEYTALREHNHRAGLLFKRLCLWRGAAHHLRDTRAMHFDGNFQRHSIGTLMG
jgi:hypothetical protein